MILEFQLIIQKTLHYCHFQQCNNELYKLFLCFICLTRKTYLSDMCMFDKKKSLPEVYAIITPSLPEHTPN